SAACWSPSDETSPRWADWLEGIAGSTVGLLVTRGPLQCTCGSGGGNPRVEIDTVKSSVALYRCSWCSQTTALVRRCGGCENAWYCNATCQQTHWAEHKSKCQQNQIE
ncbi:hypothetical protein K466DRAFT_658683, partial [Polyporus arcularius HHB13444]